MRTLIIAAHPDDESLGAGGWMAKHPGCKVAYLSEGVSARPVTAMASVERDYAERLARRREAARQAAKILQADVVFEGDFVDQTLAVTNRSLHREVTGLLQMHQPTTVLTHHPDDLNADHRAVAEIVAVACRAFTDPGRRIRRVLGFAVDAWAVPSVGVLRYDTFCGLTDAQMLTKLQAIEVYCDELRPWPHPRHKTAITCYHRWLGAITGAEYAEPYRLFWGRV